jgi:CheY-like chemotaxis protein
LVARLRDRPIILILDDDEAHRLILATVLAEAGAGQAHIVHAASAAEATKLLAGWRTKQVLVLADQHLGDAYGLQFVAASKQRWPRSRFHYVVVSSADKLVGGPDLAGAGAAAFVPKPLSIDQYIQQMRRVLSEWGALDESSGEVLT